jgi:uncharacterized protein
MDAIPLFFLLGFAARLARSDLKLPSQLYEALSIYLLLAIGLKGGVELSRQDVLQVLPQAAASMGLGFVIPLVAFPLLYKLVKLTRFDAAAIAGHYGSVSVVTFAVAMGILLARMGGDFRSVRWGALAHEIFLGKSMVLLGGGLLIGWFAGPQGMAPLEPFFFTLFKGVLCLFLLEMGLVAASQVPALRESGIRLAVFAIAMPIIAALMGTLVGAGIGLSAGGVTLLATLAASASYIAAPAAMRIAVPEANPGLSITAALVISFPFNILVGIPLYHRLAGLFHGG